VNEAQRYALALLTEECGETLQTIGKAGRFGIDTPGVKHPYTGIVDMSITPRTELEKELGDLMAAIDYAEAAGIIKASAVQSRRAEKFAKLTNPESLDNLGRKLAPTVAASLQFIAPEVDDAMCERVGEIFAAKRHGNTYHERGHAMIAAVRSELGQTLGMVPMREPSDAEFARIAREFYGDIPVCAPHIAGAHMFDAVSKWLKGEL